VSVSVPDRRPWFKLVVASGTPYALVWRVGLSMGMFSIGPLPDVADVQSPSVRRPMLLIILILILVFGVGGGWYTRGNPNYGYWGGGGIGIVGVLVICLILYALGILRL
jgi:hypothetical protein